MAFFTPEQHAAKEQADKAMPLGQLALAAGYSAPLSVVHSFAGCYIGTFDPQTGPVSRESVEYWPSSYEASEALRTGSWTQRLHP